jgi:hypothetical protein
MIRSMQHDDEVVMVEGSQRNQPEATRHAGGALS